MTKTNTLAERIARKFILEEKNVVIKLAQRVLIMWASEENDPYYIVRAIRGKRCRFVENCDKRKRTCKHCNIEYEGWRDGGGAANFCGRFSDLFHYTHNKVGKNFYK